MGTSEVQKIRKCQNASSVPWVNEILINALLGFPSFLQIPDKLTLADLGCVSMPFWAFLHFYFYSHVQVECDEDCVNALLGFPSFLLKEEFEKLKIRNVSMPFWAFLHFYLQAQVVHRNKTGMCQCPFGLSFISTASFWNPQKQSIFQAFFAGIYLKILKIMVFRLFPVLFTICSYLSVNYPYS